MDMVSVLYKGTKQVMTGLPLIRRLPICYHGYCTNQKQFTITREEKGVRTICLNDPKKRNALSLSMLQHLEADLQRESPGLRAIVLTHTGPVFSAGHDLKELTSVEGREYHTQIFSLCTRVMSSLQDLPVPVIAKISGLATAAGCQLVASCDIAVVSDKSAFATPGVNVGLFCSTPAVAVGRSVPRKVAMEMLFTGEPISAQDALLHGLVSRVVPEDKLDEEIDRITGRICDSSKFVMALGKKTFYEQINLDRNKAYSIAEKVMVDNLSLVDGQEGIKAFKEKRKPDWSHGDDKAH